MQTGVVVVVVVVVVVLVVVVVVVITLTLFPFSTAVPFWGQTPRSLSDLSP